jgi:hypothetical protein
MTYSQAKLRVSMPDSYPREAVKEAAIWILSRLDASREDIEQATFCLTNASGH